MFSVQTNIHKHSRTHSRVYLTLTERELIMHCWAVMCAFGTRALCVAAIYSLWPFSSEYRCVAFLPIAIFTYYSVESKVISQQT